ncbi:MAG: haloacid dehalogenase-like hydrolase [Prevotella sp.]|nr:haloacid dehalogenase-like hydrolase [Prevotella sp.]
MDRKRLYVFDFDGTLTKRDSLLAFIIFVRGWKTLLLTFLRYSPLLVLMKLGLYDNGKAKEKVFSACFKDMSLKTFNDYCQRFAEENRSLLREQAVLYINKVREETCVIISASVDNWVQPFFPDIRVLGTQIEVVDGKLTGKFTTPNCYGPEKVRRLLSAYPERKDYYLVAFGDSGGDRELLDYADEAYYQPFREKRQ